MGRRCAKVMRLQPAVQRCDGAMVPGRDGARLYRLSVTGQMVAALAVDHDGWLGVAQRPIDVPKMIGVALLVGGVALIRR